MRRFLGKDKHGFKYYLGEEKPLYVYQDYPDRDYWRNGKNMRGKTNGWICSYAAWVRTMHKLIAVLAVIAVVFTGYTVSPWIALAAAW